MFTRRPISIIWEQSVPLPLGPATYRILADSFCGRGRRLCEIGHVNRRKKWRVLVKDVVQGALAGLVYLWERIDLEALNRPVRRSERRCTNASLSQPSHEVTVPYCLPVRVEALSA